jgi:membrane protease subunit HflC
MKTSNIIVVILAFLALVVMSNSFFILDETEQAIITQFGKPVGDPRTDPGPNFKVPFLQKVSYFDKRYLEWDGDANQVPTKDKKFIFVDSYARWQITNPLQFFIRLRDERAAQTRLDDILDGETRNAVASHDLLDIVRSTNREPVLSDTLLEQIDQLAEIEVGREEIERLILERSNQRTADLGIRILDFKLKRINYVDEVRESIYQRMMSERKRIADQFRSEGEGEASKISGDRERDLAQIQSDAIRQSEEIRGRADAEAAAIYAGAYNKNKQSRDLYDFTRSMESFEKSLDEKTYLILSTDSEFYKFLKRGGN